MLPIALVADDLTGAMDSGLQFGKRGLDALVSTSWRSLPEAEVVVVDTDSRHVGATVAYRRVAEVASGLAGHRVYKKVDSTMRGDVGYELRALLKALGPQKIVVAPAFPAGGRSTLGGHQRVDGRPLEQTPFARDPRWPMRESHLPTLLRQQAGREVGLVGLGVVERGPDAVRDALRQAAEPIVVVDAVEGGHLRTVAEALVVAGEGWLPCGSAGLAEAWADALGLGERGAWSPLVGDAGPVLVVAGSRSDVTVNQLRRAMDERGLPCVELEPANLWDPQREAARLAEAGADHLRRGADVLLTSSLAPLLPGWGEAVAGLLAEAAGRMAAVAPLGGLFATGGDVAVAVCRALEVGALRIRHEVQAGVPGGDLVGGVCDGLRVVTKAGGFGDERALLDALDYLHGR